MRSGIPNRKYVRDGFGMTQGSMIYDMCIQQFLPSTFGNSAERCRKHILNNGKYCFPLLMSVTICYSLFVSLFVLFPIPPEEQRLRTKWTADQQVECSLCSTWSALAGHVVGVQHLDATRRADVSRQTENTTGGWGHHNLSYYYLGSCMDHQWPSISIVLQQGNKYEPGGRSPQLRRLFFLCDWWYIELWIDLVTVSLCPATIVDGQSMAPAERHWLSIFKTDLLDRWC